MVLNSTVWHFVSSLNVRRFLSGIVYLVTRTSFTVAYKRNYHGRRFTSGSKAREPDLEDALQPLARNASMCVRIDGPIA